MSKEFSVGQEVTVFGGGFSRHPARIIKITEVGKRKMKCSDKTEWTIDGYAWGTSQERGWHRSTIVPTTPAHKDDLTRLRVTSFLSRCPWDKLTTESLLAIEGFVKQQSSTKSNAA